MTFELSLMVLTVNIDDHSNLWSYRNATLTLHFVGTEISAPATLAGICRV